jgi:CheY-like chemotaxis protein
MAQVLLIDDDPGTLHRFSTVLRIAGYQVVTASSGLQGLDVFREGPVDLIIADLQFQDISGLDLLQRVRSEHRSVPFVIATNRGTTQDAVVAMRIGASDFVEKPVSEERLLRTVEGALQSRSTGGQHASAAKDNAEDQQAHAAARLVRAMAPIMDSASDPRTIQDWSRLTFVSPGALRNYCRIAGVSPRRALVFARLLRAVLLGQGGRHRPENLLDVVDRRTLVGLLNFAGLDPHGEFPTSLDAFLGRQVLVQDPDVLLEIRRVMHARRHSKPQNGPRTKSGNGTGVLG